MKHLKEIGTNRLLYQNGVQKKERNLSLIY